MPEAALYRLARRSRPKKRTERSRRRPRRSGFWLNIGLAAAGLVVAVLIYAFVSGNLVPDLGPLRAAAPVSEGGGAYQVEIRNGCGVSGLARQATSFLRDRGYDVVESGNYSDFEQEVSLVVDRSGNLESALLLARALGIDETRVTQEVSPDALLDATLIIGKDYRTLAPFSDTP